MIRRFSFFVFFFPDKGQERLVYVYWQWKWSQEKCRENTEKNQDLEVIGDEGKKWTKMEGVALKRNFNFKDDGKDMHVSFQSRIRTQGSHLSAILWVLGETGGKVLCWEWWVWSIGWGLEKNGEELGSLLGKWEGSEQRQIKDLKFQESHWN